MLKSIVMNIGQFFLLMNLCRRANINSLGKYESKLSRSFVSEIGMGTRMRTHLQGAAA